MSVSTEMFRWKISRGAALLAGLAGCSVVLILAARLVQHCIVEMARHGAGQIVALWPGVAIVAVPAGMVGTVSFAALVYGTGGLTSWHEAGSPAGDEVEQDSFQSAMPDAMDPRDRAPVEDGEFHSADGAAGALTGQLESSGGDPAANEPRAEAAVVSRSAKLRGGSLIEGELLSGSVRCEACGTMNSERVPFCAGCGEDL